MWKAGASPTSFMLLSVLVAFCSIGAFTIMNTWQRHVPPVRAGLVYTSEPVFAAAYALFLPGLMTSWLSLEYANEQLTSSLVVGGILVVIANLLVIQSSPSPSVPPDQPPAGAV